MSWERNLDLAKKLSSNKGAKGIGVSIDAERFTGASKYSKHSSEIIDDQAVKAHEAQVESIVENNQENNDYYVL